MLYLHFIVSVVGSVLSIAFIRELYNNYIQEKAKLSKTLSSNFDLVSAEIIERSVGKISYYKRISFVPYIKYRYLYRGTYYTNDEYSYPHTNEYSSSISVKRLINVSILEVFVNREKPQISYIEINDTIINKEISTLLDSTILCSILPSTVACLPIVYLFSRFIV